MDYLLQDPRPDAIDTQRWRCALIFVHHVVTDRSRAVELAANLWTLRCIGATLTPGRGGLRIGYYRGRWTDEVEFEWFKAYSLKPFRTEVSQLLKKVEQVVDKKEVPDEWKKYLKR